MFTTGSKLLIGSAFAAWIFAAIYGIGPGGILGTIGLVSAAVGLSLLATVNVFVRDSNVSATDTESFEASAAAQATARPSLWPLLVALGATSFALGIVTLPAYFIIGIVIMAAGAIEWLVQGWSERASGDRRYNADARDLLIDPVELPVAGAILAGVVAFGFSRVMLGLPSKSATVVAFAAVAAIVLLAGAAIAFQRSLSKTTLTGVLSVAGIALAVSGAIFGLNGERETHPHHTTGDLAEENECVAEETEADEGASQSVAAKSNVAVELTFTGSELEFDYPGYDGDFADLTLPRANPSNVLFRNDSDEAARLVIDLHPAVDDEGEPLSPERACTALVEEGGVQLLTVYFTQPSFALDEPLAFEVAGTDARLEVVVP